MKYPSLPLLLPLSLSVSLSLAAPKPDDPTAHGVALLVKGDPAAAAALFDKVLARDPQNVQALANRATARYRLKKFDGAIADFESAAKFKPELKRHMGASMSDAYFQRAISALGSGRKNDALRDLYAAARLDRKNPLPYDTLGDLALESGQPDTALGHFDRAVKLAPEFAGARAGRARALLLLQSPAGALAEADAAVQLDPSHAPHWRLRARIARALGRIAPAERDERRAAELERAPN